MALATSVVTPTCMALPRYFRRPSQLFRLFEFAYQAVQVEVSLLGVY